MSRHTGLLVVLTLIAGGIIYVMVKRPTITTTATTAPSSSNDWLGTMKSLFNLAGKVTDKIAPPSGVSDSDSAAVYQAGDSFDDYTDKMFGPGTSGI